VHSEPVPTETVDGLILKLQTVMWKYVGIVRTNERLSQALELVRDIEVQAEDLYGRCKLTPHLLELRNLAQVAELIILSAQSRKESRGLHYNLDYPDTNDDYKHDTILVQNGEKVPEVAARDE